MHTWQVLPVSSVGKHVFALWRKKPRGPVEKEGDGDTGKAGDIKEGKGSLPGEALVRITNKSIKGGKRGHLT